MSEETTVDTAPRDPQALLSMTEKERLALYKELCQTANEKLEPGIRGFKKLDPIKQVQCLLNHLLDYDRKTAGYRVEEITLPVRTKRHSLNQQRMARFAGQLEQALNDLRIAGYQGVAPMRFEGHGVVLIGFKPPPQQYGVFLHPAGMPIPPTMPGNPSPFQGVPPEAEEVVRKHFSNQLAHSLFSVVMRKSHEQGKVTQGDVDKIVHEGTKAVGAEGLANILSGLEDLMNEHDKAHQSDDNHPTDCQVVSELKLLHTAVSHRLRTQLS